MADFETEAAGAGTDALALGEVLSEFATVPSFFKGTKGKDWTKSKNILSQRDMWMKVSQVRPSLSWSMSEVREALAIVVEKKHTSWEKMGHRRRGRLREKDARAIQEHRQGHQAGEAQDHEQMGR